MDRVAITAGAIREDDVCEGLESKRARRITCCETALPGPPRRIGNRPLGCEWELESSTPVEFGCDAGLVVSPVAPPGPGPAQAGSSYLGIPATRSSSGFGVTFASVGVAV